MNLTIFRLATCCGLRVSEICGLRLSHVVTGVRRPYILVPKSIAKGGRARRVALWWDAGTLADLESWKAERECQGAKPGAPFVCSQSQSSQGKPLTRQNARARFISTCRILGPQRQAELTIHHGRHSFVSHALAAGHPRVVAARRWLERHFSASSIPGAFVPTREVLRNAYYYYYCWSIAHAFQRLGLRTIKTEFGEVDWAAALTEALLDRQQTNGSWTNRYTDAKENDPLVSTPFAAAALTICRQSLADNGGDPKGRESGRRFCECKGPSHKPVILAPRHHRSDQHRHDVDLCSHGDRRR